MTKKELDKELDKNKFLFVKYSLAINSLIFVAILLLLYFIKVENNSILQLIINYYINDK